ncbi:hypothetical protein LNO89_17320 [Klebsiella pneumoniae subsp. pneumoniae]|nr:hypothetical protein [Klebsiella pneumoniae subsp. pneumoniae]
MARNFCTALVCLPFSACFFSAATSASVGAAAGAALQQAVHHFGGGLRLAGAEHHLELLVADDHPHHAVNLADGGAVGQTFIAQGQAQAASCSCPPARRLRRRPRGRGSALSSLSLFLPLPVTCLSALRCC